MANKEINHGVANIAPQQSIVVTCPQGVESMTNYASTAPVEFVNGIPADDKKVIIPSSREMGAYNTNKPIRYRVVVEGKRNCIVFPTQGAKLYYAKCVEVALKSYPIHVIECSVSNNSAHFIIDSYDQTPVSYRRFFDTVNALYASYFNDNFQTAGFVFKSKLRVKRVKGDGEKTKLENVYIEPEIDRFNTVIENVLIDYGCYTKRAIPNAIMPKIIAEINERSGYEYEKIARRLALSKRDSHSTLVKVIVELTINMNQTFDQSVEALGVEVEDNGLMRDVVILLSDRLGYSVDNIFAMIGIAYCTVSAGEVVYFNDNFLVEIIKYVSETRNVSPEFVIEKFGIRNSFEDPNRILNIANMCR